MTQQHEFSLSIFYHWAKACILQSPLRIPLLLSAPVKRGALRIYLVHEFFIPVTRLNTALPAE
jgi:hypothetical protein